MWSGGSSDRPVPSVFVPASQVPIGEEIYECEINFDRALPGLHKVRPCSHFV